MDLLGIDWDEKLSHSITIIGVAISTALSLYVFNHHVLNDGERFLIRTSIHGCKLDRLNISVGFLVDNLTALMLVVVSFVSLMVHIYTIGYMHDDKGYTKFFSYISLFTFAMFTLVISNNFMQLFFGWEAVGLVSYLLIGFWHHKESAVQANLKAFLVNRVGDFGFLLGIAMVLIVFWYFRLRRNIQSKRSNYWTNFIWRGLCYNCSLPSTFCRSNGQSQHRFLCMFGCLAQWKALLRSLL